MHTCVSPTKTTSGMHTVMSHIGTNAATNKAKHEHGQIPRQTHDTYAILTFCATTSSTNVHHHSTTTDNDSGTLAGVLGVGSADTCPGDTEFLDYVLVLSPGVFWFWSQVPPDRPPAGFVNK